MHRFIDFKLFLLDFFFSVSFGFYFLRGDISSGGNSETVKILHRICDGMQFKKIIIIDIPVMVDDGVDCRDNRTPNTWEISGEKILHLFIFVVSAGLRSVEMPLFLMCR